MTMTLVSTVTVGSGGASTIEFASVPQSGTDCFILISARHTGTALNPMILRFNSDSTSSNYQGYWLASSGSAASSDNGGYAQIGGPVPDGYTSSTFGNTSVYIPNYTNSTQKSYSADSVTENNATAAQQRLTGGTWSGTGAITNIQIRNYTANTFAEYSTASLYLITKGSGGANITTA